MNLHSFYNAKKLNIKPTKKMISPTYTISKNLKMILFLLSDLWKT